MAGLLDEARRIFIEHRLKEKKIPPSRMKERREAIEDMDIDSRVLAEDICKVKPGEILGGTWYVQEV